MATGKQVDYDYSGLDLANLYLRSTNGGLAWTKTAEEHFRGPSDRPAWGGSHCAPIGGGIIRAVDGSQLPSNAVPRRIYFQRSFDLGQTWGPPEIPPEPKRPTENYLGDFGDCLSRVRRLKDGRLLATGVARESANRAKGVHGEPVVMFSKNDGQSWESHRFELTSPEMRQPGAWDEWDCAELSNGDFLAVFRRSNPRDKGGGQARWQGLLHHSSTAWFIEKYQPAPFPHSGHPELLLTHEGLILHLATTGVHWTSDAGATWHLLTFQGTSIRYKTCYYPRSLQTKDWRILVFSHRGSDNPYGKVDQSIIMDSFRLERD